MYFSGHFQVNFQDISVTHEYTNIPNTANNDIVHSDNHDNFDQTLAKRTVDSVQSDGLMMILNLTLKHPIKLTV